MTGVQTCALPISRLLVIALPLLLIGGRAAADAALSIVMILFLVRSYREHDWSWLRLTWVRVAAVLWIWTLVVSFFAFDPARSFYFAIPWIRFLLFAVALEVWVLNEIWLRRLLFATGITLGFAALDTWLQYFTGSDIFGHPKWSDIRLTGPFDRPKIGIYIVKLMFPVLLGLFFWMSWRRKSVWPKVVLGVIATVMSGAVFISGERMESIFVVFGVVVAVFLIKGFSQRVLRSTALVTLVLSLLAAGFVALSDNRVAKHQFSSAATMLSSFGESAYGEVWLSAWTLGTARPVTGVGMNNFRIACKEPEVSLPATFEHRCLSHPHNYYLEWLAESGFPGLLGFLVLIAVRSEEHTSELQSH